MQAWELSCVQSGVKIFLSLSLQSFEQDGWSKDGDGGQIQKAASAIIGALSKRQNSTIMPAVVEVKVETQSEATSIGESVILVERVNKRRQTSSCREAIIACS